MAIEALRTPNERFEHLSSFEYAPHYLDGCDEQAGLRLHYLDEGPSDATVVFLCLHGEPSWSYLYRKMIPSFVTAGHRVLAPDFYGFGRSDKPVSGSVYTFGFHRKTLIDFVDRLDLRNICLVCQDWGGLLGLTLPMDMPDRFTRLLVMNTAIAQGRSPGEGFDAWKAYVKSNPDLNVGALLQRSQAGLTDAEAKAYNAPFPSTDYKSGVRRFPELVPVTPNMEGTDLGVRAAKWWRTEWTGESFMAVGMQDPVLGPDRMAVLRETIRNCPPPLEIPEGGHFVQECGDRIAPAALSHFGLG